MPDVTPTGILSLPMSRLRAMLADCPAWRSWCGAADATAALAFISLVDRGHTSGTFAIIDVPHKVDATMEGVGPQNLLYEEGEVFLFVQGEVPAEYRGTSSQDEANAFTDFTNRLGAVLSELKDRAGVGEFLNLNGFHLAPPGITRYDPKFRESLGDFIQATLIAMYR